MAVGVPGIKVTAWWPGRPPALKNFDGIHDIWVGAATALIELDLLEDADGQKHQVCIFIRIHRYPEDWTSTIRKTLEYLLAHGAAIAWAGGWECIPRYSPQTTFAGCYAVMTRQTGFICHGGLNDPVRYIGDVPGVIDQLHEAVTGHTSAARIPSLN